MKSMKRMLSLLLVALLLVSAVPMFASAQAVEGDFGDGPGEVVGQLVDPEPQTNQYDDPVTFDLEKDPVAFDLEKDPVTYGEEDGDDDTTTKSITVNAVLITRDANGGTTRTLTLQRPYSPNATLENVLMVGLNQKALTNGITEFQKYEYKYIDVDNSDAFKTFNQFDAAGVYDGAVTLAEIAGDATTIYLQFYRTRLTVDVTLSLNGSTYGDYVKKNVPLYSTLNLPSAFSAAKLAPDTGYYIAYYEDYNHQERGPITSPSSYLITQETKIIGYQDLTANKPVNSGNVDTSGGSGSNNGSGSGSNNGSVGSITGSGSGSSSNNGSYNKFPYNVYLNIYKDTMVGAPDKTINITKGAAIDGTVTMDEVKALVMNHYKAKDSYGISFDGLYLAEGTWVTNYVTDTEKYDKFIDVDTFRQYRTVYINVMIDNATAKSSSSGTADTSNPKTGDSIYAPIAVLGVSATALAAAMFFYNKKRLAK